MEKSQNRTRFKGMTRTAVNNNVRNSWYVFVDYSWKPFHCSPDVYVNTKDATNSVCNVTVYHT